MVETALSTTQATIHPDAQRILDSIQQQFGLVPAILQTLAVNPGLLRSFIALNTASTHTHLDAGLRDLAYLKVSQINQCGYCAHYHQQSGLEAGLTDAQVDQVAQSETSPVYTALQRHVMRYAAQVTQNIQPDPQLVEILLQDLSNTELIELTLVIGLANLTNRFNVALGMQLP